jgi:hypothetical protein
MSWGGEFCVMLARVAFGKKGWIVRLSSSDDHGAELWKSAIEFGAVSLLAVLLGWIVRPGYLGVPGVHDDHLFEWLIGEHWLGRLSAWEMFAVSHSGQLVPLGLAIYEQLMAWLGVESSSFSIFALVAHSAAAGMIYVYLKPRFGGLGAGVAAFLWAGSAIGRWDNTLLWRANVVLVAVPFTWLLALWSLDQYQQRGGRRWLALSVVASVVVIAQWNAGVLLLPAVVMQAGWLGSRKLLVSEDRSRLLVRWLLLGGVLAIGLGGAWLGLRVASRGVPSDWGALERWPLVGWVAPSFFAVGLGDWTFWNGSGWGTNDLRSKWLVFVGLLVLTSWARPRDSWVLLLFGMTGLLYTAAVALLRADLGGEVILTSGRYFTVPILVLSVWLGGLVSGLEARFRDPMVRRSIWTVIAMTLGWHVFHQRMVAAEAAAQFDGLWRESVATLEVKRQGARELARLGSEEEPMPVPDLPLDVPPVAGPFALSTLVAVMEDDVGRRLRLVAVGELSASDLQRASRSIAKLPAPLSREWLSLARSIQEDARSLRWLSRWSSEQKERILLPAMVRRYQQREFAWSDWSDVIMGTNALAFGWGASKEQTQDLMKRLQASPDGEARVWLERLEQARDGWRD